MSKFAYTVVPGHFVQDGEPEDISKDVFTLPGLGLIEGSFGETNRGWAGFPDYLDQLNSESDQVRYKLVFATRHGEGYHNVKEAEVGTAAWESHWAKLEGDGKSVWADADLTPKGRGQAMAANAFWKDAAANLGLPLPRRHYCSPHSRCLDTCTLGFADIPGAPPFRPIVKEMIRERMGVHTCDRRRTRTWITENHPQFTIEEGFKEADELWKPDVRETLPEHAVRMKAFLDDLFTNDEEPIVSLTIHSGSIMALFSVIGHVLLHVAPGSIVPMLVRAEKIA
ncbi:histidine phosphatase superfamily [Podospora conica]|nr:histidine phosphatase superfamily [Schizothecium conicum]